MHTSTLVRSGRHQTKQRSVCQGPLLVKIGGAAVDQAEEHGALFEALCDLHRAERAAGGGVVLVHGGGVTVDRRLERLGMVSERREGIRITPPEHIDEVVAGLAGSVNKKLVGRIQRCGVPAVGLCLGDGLIANSRQAGGYSFDPGRVGEIDGGNPRLMELLIGGGFMPVLCSIGLDDAGHPLNINADDAATGLAGLLDCRALILLTDVEGVLDAKGRLLDELTPDEIERRISRGEIRDGMIPKVRGAARAARVSQTPVTITSWNQPGKLVRLARGESIGTRIVMEHTAEPASIPNSFPAVPALASTAWSDLL